MKSISVFNDVLGPVMRGPSSSHTAGSYHLARIARDLLGAQPVRARIAFDPAGSYARVYCEQGVDRAFAVGLLDWPLADPRFFQALELAPAERLDLEFEVRPLERADHPNTADIDLTAADGRSLRVVGRSIGGGLVEVLAVDGWPVRVTGETCEVLVETDAEQGGAISTWLAADGQAIDTKVIIRIATPQPCRMPADPSVPDVGPTRTRVLVHARRLVPVDPELRSPTPGPSDSRGSPDSARPEPVEGHTFGPRLFREVRALAFVKRGAPLFDSAEAAVDLSLARSVSLAAVAMAHETSLLGLPDDEVASEMSRRLAVMMAAVDEGLGRDTSMQLLEPSARRVFKAEAAGRLAMGGPHTRAAARALAAMQTNSSMGVVCAAPTGGSAGVLPAVIVTLIEQAGLRSRGGVAQGLGPVNAQELAIRALFAAAAIGVVVAARATFAAEIAGCQVEIGAAGAMAAAAVVEAAGGTAQQACDAAAIAFQNTMGSVCDLVQGIVEIPCHTRNAVAASSAFVCADLVMGGYRNPIPLDETIDAVLSVGRMLPAELRCTARGGLAVTPAALKLRKK